APSSDRLSGLSKGIVKPHEVDRPSLAQRLVIAPQSVIQGSAERWRRAQHVPRRIIVTQVARAADFLEPTFEEQEAGVAAAETARHEAADAIDEITLARLRPAAQRRRK